MQLFGIVETFEREATTLLD